MISKQPEFPFFLFFSRDRFWLSLRFVSLALGVVDPRELLSSHCLKIFWLSLILIVPEFSFLAEIFISSAFKFLEMVDPRGSIGLQENPETSAFLTSRSRVFSQSFSVNSFTLVT